MPIITDPRPLYRHLYGEIFQMSEELKYRDKDTNEIYNVEEGFRWNKGSIIKLLPRAIVPHGDEMTYPSAIHDKHYNTHSVPRRVADRILRQFLIEEFDHARRMKGKKGKSWTGRMKAWTAWSAVRLNLIAEWNWGNDA